MSVYQTIKKLFSIQILIYFFCIHLFILNTSNAQDIDCEDQLLPEHERILYVTSLIEKEILESTSVRKLYLKALKASYRNRILEECTAKGFCTVAEVQEAAQTNLEKTRASYILKSARSYGVIALIMGSSAYIGMKLTTGMSPAAAQLVTIFISMGIYDFGSPIMSRLSSWVQNYSFGLNQKADVTALSKKMLRVIGALEGIWHRGRGIYPINAQIARNTLMNLLNGAQINLQSAYLAMKRSDIKYAAAQIAELLVRQRKLVAEVSPLDESLRDVARAALLNHFSDQELFILKEAVIVELRSLDTDFVEATIGAHYTKILNFWFKA